MAMQVSIFMEIAIAFLIFFITRFSTRSIFFRKHWKLFPPGPKGWPLIGALPLLGAMPHVTLAEMVKKYGPVMFLNLGACNMVVALSPQAANAFLKTLDMNFSNRAPNAGATHLLMILKIWFSPTTDPDESCLGSYVACTCLVVKLWRTGQASER
ncbi:hypothetical protein FEM48_Zijuj02G0045400 [Ziziphus jujuba var. spinosa]|uniref:Flavonoid 3',5'-hydroxylase n=1 Tax=Ziziphus jujuba var. spinosa TaxID=714518 RepID=A0A978VTN1_ZIZJJ|nr:hypothetical protein FEM48_Zijuj02G0045400 [Ziziphus jujuba var. spinosa]